MKRRYYVGQYGYCFPNPDGLTLSEARRELVRCLREERIRCKRRYGFGHVVRTSKDCGRVVFGGNLWAAFAIHPLY